MTSTHKAPKKITAVLAIVFLLPAVYIFAVWINVFNQDLTQQQKIVEFIKHFPVNDIKIITYFSMACCIVAMVLAAKSFKQRLISFRIVMWLTVMLASLIFFMDIFQLL